MIFRAGKRPKMCPPVPPTESRKRWRGSRSDAFRRPRELVQCVDLPFGRKRDRVVVLAHDVAQPFQRATRGRRFFRRRIEVNGSMIDANSLLTARCVASLRKRVRLLPKADIGCEHQDAGVKASDATQPCCFPRRTSKRNSYRSRKSLIKAGFFVFQRRPDRRAALARKGARRRAAWPIWLTRSRTGLAAASPFNPKICPAGRTQNQLGLRPRSQAGKMRLAQ